MKEQLEQLLNNSTILTEANLKLVENNTEAIKLVKESINKYDKLQSVSLQIYQALCDKKNKSVKETAWYNGLKKVFEG